MTNCNDSVLNIYSPRRTRNRQILQEPDSVQGALELGVSLALRHIDFDDWRKVTHYNRVLSLYHNETTMV